MLRLHFLFKSFLHVVESRGKGRVGAFSKGSMLLFLLDLCRSHSIKSTILDQDLEELSVRGGAIPGADQPFGIALDFLGLCGAHGLLFAHGCWLLVVGCFVASIEEE